MLSHFTRSTAAPRGAKKQSSLHSTCHVTAPPGPEITRLPFVSPRGSSAGVNKHTQCHSIRH
eukprot:3190384-Pyramimonas_sp.AAC.1